METLSSKDTHHIPLSLHTMTTQILWQYFASISKAYFCYDNQIPIFVCTISMSKKKCSSIRSFISNSWFKSNLIWLGNEHVAMLSSGSTEVVWPVPHFNVDRQFCVPLAPTCTYNPLSVLFQWLLSVIISYTTLHDNTSAFGLTAKRIARTCYSPYHGRCAGRQRMNNSLRNTKNRLNRTETMHSTLCFDITTLLAWLPYLHPHA